MTQVTVKAEVSGTVFRVEVAPGELVSAGATLILVESMKMEIPVQAPRSGRVSALFVAQGQVVGEGDALLTIETGPAS